MNEETMSDVRREASRHLSNKKREYLEDKINEIPSESKKQIFRDLYTWINEFQIG
jgi:hypothetical protein